MMEPVKKRRGAAVTGNRAMDIGILIDRVLQKNHIAEDVEFTTISGHFSEVVGGAVLPYVKLVKLEKRTLVLKAVNSAWKQELFLQKNTIIERCNSLLGSRIPAEKRFVSFL